MMYVIQNGDGHGTKYASEPMNLGEHRLEELPEMLRPLVRQATEMYTRDVREPTETRAYRLKLPDGRGVVINVQSRRGNNQLRRRSCC